METYDLTSWDEFRPLVDRLRAKYGYLHDSSSLRNDILYRGHADAAWPLATTLERRTPRRFYIAEYAERAAMCENELESATGRRWDVPCWPDLLKEIKEKRLGGHAHLPCYDYLVYLRHHGFPSPLLDWSESPYIAAYFALFEPAKAERVAVDVYVEMPEGMKGGPVGAPEIRRMGQYVTTDERHFAQQAMYTFAVEYDKGRDEHFFCPHSVVFERGDPDQDLLFKITIPSSERARALEDLGASNINHYTLFRDEDALVKALAMKVFDYGTSPVPAAYEAQEEDGSQ